MDERGRNNCRITPTPTQTNKKTTRPTLVRPLRKRLLFPWKTKKKRRLAPRVHPTYYRSYIITPTRIARPVCAQLAGKKILERTFLFHARYSRGRGTSNMSRRRFLKGSPVTTKSNFEKSTPFSCAQKRVKNKKARNNGVFLV